MKKYFILFSLLLSGCATTGSGDSGIVSQVQAITVQICKFEPTAETIISIVGQAVPGLSAAGAIAKAICNAVGTPHMLGARRGVPTVAGIQIHGRFIR